ncbi:MAG TPA: glycerol kinase GlpK [Gemmatimonadaceae bacterium]|nr:glycerol kinase GlpK [Gemmatimonadaceae bacterium]
MKAILALDQGTTSSRAILFDERGSIAAVAKKELRQIYPRPGWVEHDPGEIASTQLAVAAEAVAQVPGVELVAIGITNQRETTLLWDRDSGKPVANAIVWQDRRTAALCDELRGHEPLFRKKTGLLLDPYFSGTKIRWLLDRLGAGPRLAFGTVDSWLIWQLTAGRVHVTDATNASRTLLFDIHRREWDDELLGILGIPREMLPAVVSSSEVVGETASGLPIPAGIPIAGIAGDQQAALFGQRCTRPGMAKNTYGTGCFIVMNTGENAVESKHGLLTTVTAEGHYALEGSIFIAGAAVQWLRDSLGIIATAPEIEPLAASVEDSGGVVFVPAFTGLGAPHWDPHARGAIVGLTRGSSPAHIARAALDAIALQTAEVLEAMRADSGLEVTELRVDGAASTNDLLMQTQADLAGARVVRAAVPETTALGAAYLAGLAAGLWGENDIDAQWRSDRVFEPRLDPAARRNRLARWREAVSRVR